VCLCAQVVLKADGDEKLDVAREMLLEGFARLPRLHKVGGGEGLCSWCSGRWDLLLEPWI
jgi:hypothetical protein